MIAFAVVLAACSSDAGDGALPAMASEVVEEPTTAPPVSMTTESTADSTETPDPTSTTNASGSIEEVLAGQIRGYFDARAAANAAPAPNPDDPALANFAAGEELVAVTAGTEARRDAGQAIRPGGAALADVRVGFVTANTSSASAAACVVDDGVIFDVVTGTVVNDDVVTHNYQVDLELHDGTWKVSRIVRVQQWEGVAGCALSAADYPF